MSIEKNTKNTLKHEELGFTTVINETISLIKNTSALGVYCFLASKSSNWNICKKHLQTHFNCGREHIDSCFRYLKKIGAIEVIMIRNSKGQCEGWETTLKRKIPTPQENHNTGNPYSGNLSRIRETQNLDKPDSGKSAPINKRNFLSNKRGFKKNRSVPVFSCSTDVKNHILEICNNRKQIITNDIADQIVFWIDDDNDPDSVLKKINTALKLAREEKWKIPHGFKGITSKSIKEKEQEYESKKQLQHQEDAVTSRTIHKAVLSNAGISALNDMFRMTRGNIANAG